MDRPLPRSAPGVDGQARPERIQADAGIGRLLARRSQESDAEPDLRDGLAQQETARRLSPAARGSGQARSSQDRPRDGSVPSSARSAWKRLLASERLGDLAAARGVYAPPARRG